ncbi:MAG: hypothetical protein SH850_13180 [Planctomycetaceae bacterium]|nr:hypothetical protein [Planctomycetaceae bacterium]
MSTDTAAMHELEEALERIAAGRRDPERMRQAVEELERSCEETRSRVGILDVCVELIRDARNP